MLTDIILSPLRRIYYVVKKKQADKILLDDFTSAYFPSNEYILFITHDLGGGTEQYVQNFIKENRNERILILRNVSYINDFFYIVDDVKTGKKYKMEKFESIFLRDIAYSKVILNSLVSFKNWESILKTLELYKNRKNYSLSYMVHDFHSICPQFNLFYKNRYCKLECNKMNCKFNQQLFGDYKSIDYWQKTWKTFLLKVDKIRCFSENSKQILLKKYPLDEKRIFVIPHSMEYCNFSPIIPQKTELRIAIVGNINNNQKGALVVKNFLKSCKKERIPVTIIGELKKNCIIHGGTIKYFGHYRQNELENILRSEKINFVFFPSICPETFSFLVSEIMQTKLPIICFNIGAQADKIQNYENGICVDLNSSIESIIRRIKLFIKEHT